MKTYNSLVILIMVIGVGYSQSWKYLNPVPTGNSLNSVKFTGADTGYAVGREGTVLKTVDAGKTWATLNSGGNEWLSSVSFTNSAVGIAVGIGGIILRTTDGGVTWTPYKVNGAAGLNSVVFVNAQLCFAVGSMGLILKSVDGGVSWTSTRFGDRYAELQSVCFVDTAIGYIFGKHGAGGLMLKTTDGGKVWTPHEIELKTIHSAFFSDAENGFAISDTERIVTSDGGVNWTTQNPGKSRLWTKSAFFLNSKTGFVVGIGDEGGLVAKTIDGGKSWTRQVSNAQSPLASVFFTDASRGCAVGDDGEIITTINGGQSWKRRIAGDRGWLHSVCFPGSDVGFATGDNGAVFATVNGGKTWNLQKTGVIFELTSVFFIDTKTGYCVGKAGTILKTINAGLTWKKLTSGTNALLYSVFFTDAMTGYVVGEGGVFKTTNAGEKWTPQVSGNEKGWLTSVLFINTDTGYIAGSHGAIFKTTNGGSNWMAQQSGTAKTLNSICFINDSTGFAVGEEKTILKTTNGGTSWGAQSYSSYAKDNFNSVCFLDENTGFIVGDNGSLGGKILKTVNGGATWMEDPCFTEKELKCICFPSEKNAVAVGINGTIMQRTLPVPPATAPVSAEKISALKNESAAVSPAPPNASAMQAKINRTAEIFEGWTECTGDMKGYFHSIWANGKKDIFVAGSNGLIRSGNRGKSWKTVLPGLCTFVWGASDNDIYAGGKALYHSNSGNQWDKQIDVSSLIQDIVAVGSGKVLAISQDGDVYITSNHGQNWSQSKLPLLNGNPAALRAYSANGIILVGGENGILLRSKDNGLTWYQVSFPGTHSIAGFWSPPGKPATIYANYSPISVTPDGCGLARSNDAGATWSPWLTFSIKSFTSSGGLWGTSANDFYIAYYEDFLHTRDGGVTWEHSKMGGSNNLGIGDAGNDVYLLGLDVIRRCSKP
jgi:photosystem II stability/assembly factor-like uncharacterized protein